MGGSKDLLSSPKQTNFFEGFPQKECQYCSVGNVTHMIVVVSILCNHQIVCQGLNLSGHKISSNFGVGNMDGEGGRVSARPLPLSDLDEMKNLILFASSSTLWLSMSGKSSFILQLKNGQNCKL